MPRKAKPKPKGFFSIRVRKDGYAEYRVADTKAEIGKPSAKLLGKFHSHVANYPQIKQNWYKDAEKKGLEEVPEATDK